jgi:hypothetical protein
MRLSARIGSTALTHEDIHRAALDSASLIVESRLDRTTC